MTSIEPIEPVKPHYREFNFVEYKKLLCTAYQTANFNEALYLGKIDYLEVFDEALPYPIQQCPEEYELFCRFLEEQIRDCELLSMELITKTEAKNEYKLTDRFFTLFYSQPEDIVEIQNSRERFGGATVYSHLYNRNKIISIMESDEYQEYQLIKKNKKINFLN